MNKIPKVSLFESTTLTKPTSNTAITQLFENIKLGYWKDVVERVRAVEDAKERRELKTKILPAVTISGTFSERKDSALLEYSGMIAIDIDHREEDYERVWNIVKRDPYTYCAFRSVSGHGLCVILTTSEPLNHQDHFRWAEEHYQSIGDIAIDTACKNVSRLRFVSYDPDLFINNQAKPAGKKKLKKNDTPKPPPLPSTSSQIDRIISEIGANGIDLTDNYGDWLNIAFAFATEYGEAGRNYFHNVSAISSKYDFQKAERKYNNALAEGRGDVTISSFLYLAKNAGIELYTDEEKQAFAIAQAAKRGNSDVQTAIISAEQNGINPELTKEIAEKVFETSDYDKITTGDSIVNEIAAFIKFNTALEVNSISQKLENNGTPITDKFYDSIYIKCKASISDKVTKTDVTAIINSDLIPEYCPIQRWVDDHEYLPEKPEIIEELLNTIPYEKPEARRFIYHWLLGIPATYYGDIVRLVLVLCGRQETGKTQFFRRLIPEGLSQYYSENNLMDDDESPLIMGTKIINMDDEFGGKSRKDALKFKELTSKNKFDVRLKYGRTITTIKRLAMLCGTSNDTEIINDETGNTRILPVEFHNAYDFEAYNKIDKDQLFIELFRAYKRGESWELSEEARQTLSELNQVHTIADFELELIDMYLTEAPYSDLLSTTEIKAGIEKRSGQRILSPRKLGTALKKRYDQQITKVDGKTKRGYRCIFKDEQGAPF